MEHTPRWFNRIGRRGSPSAPPSEESVRKALSSDIARVHAQDPDTTGQWNLLRARMEKSPGMAAAVPSIRPGYRIKPAIAFAFGVTVVVVVAGLLWFRPAPPLLYQTGVAERSTILLADSSEVTLNHNSELAVLHRDEKGGRRTALTGEAFFKVRKTGAPFIVETNTGSVQVLGTEFNVRVRQGEMEVAVVSGRVQVTASRQGNDSTVVLRAGQFTALSKGGLPAHPEELPFATDYPGWMHNKFLFHRMSITMACRRIAEEFGVPIVVDTSRLTGETFTGVVDGRSIEAAVKTLCVLSGASYRYEHSTYTVY
jgi:transmembrane sensor